MPTEPSLCASCGTRPGSECAHNAISATGEPSDPDPASRLCRPCLEEQTRAGWTGQVENVRRLIARYPSEQAELERGAAVLATHIRMVSERRGLAPPQTVERFVAEFTLGAG
jgi:hypothetical protein